MRVKRAKTAGFCMGVSLALKKLETAISRCEAPIRTLGPIIHNPQVLASFENRGVKCIDSPTDAAPEAHVLIRAHGIPREVEERLRQSCAQVEDATCPKVKKAQLAIANATKNGATLLLFGEESHPEVAGLISYANGPAWVFGSREDLEQIRFDSAPGLVLASQTTQDREIFESIATELASAYPQLKVLSTICDATRERQQEALRIASQVEAMVVIGGRASGNTRRLANLARGAGIETFLVETAAELTADQFRGKSMVGLTAGASTPMDLIDEAEKWLAGL